MVSVFTELNIENDIDNEYHLLCFVITPEPVVESSVQQKVIDFLQVGGPVVWILIGFSVIALTIVLLKLWQLSSLRAESRKTVDQALAAWRKKEGEQALELLDEKRPIDSLVGFSMRSLRAGNMDVNLIREEVERLAMNQLNQLRSYLRPLEIIASLSPLLGLLGTVLGMITAFQQMQGAGNQVDPSVLSGGIWQALLTTAVGLAVAIPVVSLHSWLERKIERIAHNINDAVTQVFTSKEAERLVAKAAKEVLHAA
ncbi:Biopolymer transport protein ExbB [Marinomonas spartinae]|uniref:Biopolymer transport protein ExbB n=1 Tax=Marinomonas spartinae TaxID=1792290 RepID=A0A1A8TPY6_9GAMM|nr:MotA/TolQ/ExbB proton channel family protein [Marinomonas spartinae]SBS31012.1 Biopolymer transport protein ExbB [Marinomonas spartinae]SBS36001.1 Biopolymer transport protein ExbB [Marinomonas spartinae]